QACPTTGEIAIATSSGAMVSASLTPARALPGGCISTAQAIAANGNPAPSEARNTAPSAASAPCATDQRGACTMVASNMTVVVVSIGPLSEVRCTGRNPGNATTTIAAMIPAIGPATASTS